MLRRPPIIDEFSIIMMDIVAALLVLGILLSQAITAYPLALGYAQVTAAVANVEPLINEIYLYYAIHGRWPDSDKDLSLSRDDQYQDSLKGTYLVEKGSLHIMFTSGDRNLNGKVLSLRKARFSQQKGATTLWLCGYQEIPAGMSVDVANRTNLDRKYLIKRCK